MSKCTFRPLNLGPNGTIFGHHELTPTQRLRGLRHLPYPVPYVKLCLECALSDGVQILMVGDCLLGEVRTYLLRNLEELFTFTSFGLTSNKVF